MTALFKHPASSLRMVDSTTLCVCLAAGAPRAFSHATRRALPHALESRHAWRSTVRQLKGKTPSNKMRAIRPFSGTSSRAGTIVAVNPRKDDDGNDMLVEITASAAKRLKEIMRQDADPDLALRVTVQSGGCHGFQYLMSLTNSKNLSPEDDTVFEADDGSGARVVMDEPSLELLKGSKVDYTIENIGSQFEIVDNPAAFSSCGCGTSFDIKT